MKLKFYYLYMLVYILGLLSLSACSNPDVNRWNATCHMAVENLPPQLPPTLQDHIDISVTLRDTTTNKLIFNHLSAQNAFQQTLALKPGKYEVTSVYTSNHYLDLLAVRSPVTEFEVSKNSQFYLPIQITDVPSLVESIQANQPKAEILALDPYARQIQYRGQIIDLNRIQEIMVFSRDQSKRLSPAETAFIPSTSHSGVAIKVQNKSQSFQSIQEASLIGVKFTNSNTVLPKGIQIGSSIEQIAHAQKGLLGSPNYCLGSPISGLDHLTLVYLDDASGDKISLFVRANTNIIYDILYEFEQYE